MRDLSRSSPYDGSCSGLEALEELINSMEQQAHIMKLKAPVHAPDPMVRLSCLLESIDFTALHFSFSLTSL